MPKKRKLKQSKQSLLTDVLEPFIPVHDLVTIVMDYFAFAIGTVFVNRGPIRQSGILTFSSFAFILDRRWAPSMSRKRQATIVKYRLMSLPHLVIEREETYLRWFGKLAPDIQLMTKILKATSKKERNDIHRGRIQSVTEDFHDDQFVLCNSTYVWQEYKHPVYDIYNFGE